MSPQGEKPSSSDEFCVVVIPSLENYRYLQCLYRQILELAKKKRKKLSLYSPSGVPSGFRKRVFYPFEILFLLLRRKSCAEGRTILHLHWIEFLYLWWNNRYLVPFIVPLIIVFLRFVKSFSKNRLLVTVHNILPHDVHWFAVEYNFFKIMLRELSDGVFVHSNLAKASLMSFYGIPEKKVHVIRHGLIESKKPSAKHNQVLKFNISEGDVVLFFVGAISEYKGVDVLLQAIKALLTTEIGKSLRFIIAGRADKEYLQYLLKTYGETLKDGRVTFMGKYVPEEEVEGIFDVADFGICPYTRATTPSTILDFMYHRLPIITTDDPNVLNLVEGYPSIIAIRGDSLSLASCISLAYHRCAEYKEKAKAFDLASLFDAWRISAEITLESYMTCAPMEALF